MDIIEIIRQAGIVGCGGAGFPTDRKLTGHFRYLIANGAECEPMLRTDRYLMCNKAPELIHALEVIAGALGVERCVIALKAHDRAELAALRAAIAQAGAKIELHVLENFYPAGDEQTMVYAVTGQVVPPAGIPSAVGAVVDNIATIYAISEALQGRPLTEKYLTVTGEVPNPVIVKAPIGTPLLACIELAGGMLRPDACIMTGGPLMGKQVGAAELERAVVTKTTSGILVLPGDGCRAQCDGLSIQHMLNRARSACIQCMACTQLCPRHMLGHPLQPHKIMRKLAMGQPLAQLLDDPELRAAQLCCECGICEVYACPMGLQPRRLNAMIKQALTTAGIRYAATEQPCHPDPAYDDRKVPSARIASRAGVRKYYAYEITELCCAEPARVEIPLRMHIGAPCKPMVAPGAPVGVGDLIAAPPDGALGARIHASITGRVQSVSDRIVIVKE